MGALGQPGQRADQVGRQLAVGAGVEQNLLGVPVGVVVGEDRVVEIVGAAGDLQVPGGGADRVDRVVGVFAPVAVGVDAVRFPARRQELHPADGAGAGDVEVGAEGGLDFVDRGQHLPGDSVFGSAGLVDRQQEGRDLEGVDDEVGDADRGRAERRDRRRRVGQGRRAAGVELGAAIGFFGQRLVAAAGGAGGADAAVGAAASAGVAEALVMSDAAAGVAGAGRVAVDRAALLEATGFTARGRRRFGGGQGSRGVGARSRGRGRGLAGAAGRGAVRVGEIDQAVAVVVDPVGAGRGLQRGDRGNRRAGGLFGRSAFGHRVGGHRHAKGGQRQEAGEYDYQCDLGSHPSAPRCPLPRNAESASAPSPRGRRDHATCSPRGTQRRQPSPNKALINIDCIPDRLNQD